MSFCHPIYCRRPSFLFLLPVNSRNLDIRGHRAGPSSSSRTTVLALAGVFIARRASALSSLADSHRIEVWRDGDTPTILIPG